MPKIATKTTKFPEGWEVVQDTLDDFERKMRDAIAEPHEGKRKVESLWPVMQINHQRSRYIYEMYYKKHAISKKVCILRFHLDWRLYLIPNRRSIIFV